MNISLRDSYIKTWIISASDEYGSASCLSYKAENMTRYRIENQSCIKWSKKSMKCKLVSNSVNCLSAHVQIRLIRLVIPDSYKKNDVKIGGGATENWSDKN